MRWKKLTLIFLTALCLFFSLKFCLMEKNKLQSPKQQNLQGYGLTVEREITDHDYGFVIDNQDKQKFNYNVRFMNHSGTDNTFVLTVYIDYCQIPFIVASGTSKTNAQLTYTFSVKHDQEQVIPIRFPYQGLQGGEHSLVFSVVAGPEKHARTIGTSTEGYGVTVRYELLTSNDRKFEQDRNEPEIPIDVFSASQFNGIRINQDENPTEKAMLPPLSVSAKAGDKIDFTMLAGGDQDTQNYLAWVTLGFKQVPLDKNNDLYWYFHVPESKFASREIQIIAPKEKGDYEICAYLAPNPWVELDDGLLRNVEVRSSYRFTLHVE